MRITDYKEENQIRLVVEGKVDTATSLNLQQAILTAFQKSKHVFVDFTDVEYISSSGLRALIIGQKTAQSKGGSMVLSGCKGVVLEVLKASGCVKILTII